MPLINIQEGLEWSAELTNFKSSLNPTESHKNLSLILNNLQLSSLPIQFVSREAALSPSHPFFFN